MCFIEDEDVYLYPHDKILNTIDNIKGYVDKHATWSNKKLTKVQKGLLQNYKL